MSVDCRIALRCTGIAFVAVLIVGVTLVTPSPTGFPVSQDSLWVLLLGSALTPAAVRGGTGRER
ncbi:hypothetical protein OEIGOIKO_07779 [Streptomyces chrestomyceticus JCM 4735]|uniref:Uncharacterized protein n=1 Tax=Streptomyces chrestomyceticus JCM 4735 TaxID=1306181 RepID=A0A7U9Q0W0_9ACTN|nr:hypothetical protein [Streptomyces chrestomyceticus]GCD39922.1 hypothetical protein OEIGOIKO_07779 [Streptomyces chrestomyceticus JCM 4735]